MTGKKSSTVERIHLATHLHVISWPMTDLQDLIKRAEAYDHPITTLGLAGRGGKPGTRPPGVTHATALMSDLEARLEKLARDLAALGVDRLLATAVDECTVMVDKATVACGGGEYVRTLGKIDVRDAERVATDAGETYTPTPIAPYSPDVGGRPPGPSSPQSRMERALEVGRRLFGDN